MTIDEKALKVAESSIKGMRWDVVLPRDIIEAYEQAKSMGEPPNIYGAEPDAAKVLRESSPTNTAVLVGATCRCGAKMVVSENFKPDTALVKKLVDALEPFCEETGIEHSGTIYEIRARQALTEANAYLERISHDK